MTKTDRFFIELLTSEQTRMAVQAAIVALSAWATVMVGKLGIGGTRWIFRSKKDRVVLSTARLAEEEVSTIKQSYDRVMRGASSPNQERSNLGWEPLPNIYAATVNSVDIDSNRYIVVNRPPKEGDLCRFKDDCAGHTSPVDPLRAAKKGEVFTVERVDSAGDVWYDKHIDSLRKGGFYLGERFAYKHQVEVLELASETKNPEPKHPKSGQISSRGEAKIGDLMEVTSVGNRHLFFEHGVKVGDRFRVSRVDADGDYRFVEIGGKKLESWIDFRNCKFV